MRKSNIVHKIWAMQNYPRWDDEAPRLPDDYASHSGRVAIYSLIAGLIENKVYGKNLDLEKLVCRALFHDMKVTFTGSINHDTKKDPLVKDKIEMVEERGSRQIVKELQESVQERFEDYILNALDDSEEGRLVDAIDSFDAMFYCHREVLFGSTYYFPGKFDEIYVKLRNCQIPSIQYMMKSFDLKDGLYLFLLSVMMLDRVRRWKGKFSMIPDNDGVHLFRASALAVYFATIEKDVHHLDLNLLDVVSSTLLHDVVEKRTGDVLGPVKHASPEIKKAFEEYEKKISLEMVDLLPDFLRIFFIENMVNAKDETSKGEMVDMVDKLDAMLKSNMERGMNPFYYELDFQEQLEKIKTKFKRPSLKFFFDEIFPSMDYDRK